MQNLLTSVQMRSADAFTIRQRHISSIELMEAASLAFAGAFIEEVADKNTSVAVLCGKGNNGADGLAVSRILKEKGYEKITVFLIHFSTRETEEYRVNLDRLTDLGFQPVTVTAAGQLAGLEQEVIIDAVLGSGLNKVLAGNYLELAELVNTLGRKVIAVDVPTGFPAEGVINKDIVCIKADLVICFQRPKINFFFPESLLALNRFRVVDIGLDEDFIQQQDSPYQLTSPSFIRQLVKPRQLFSHKGTYGHALIVAGQANTMGAALLSARACLFGGAGLTTLSIPESGLTALNASLPEVMYVPRTKLTEAEGLKKYKAIAIGPGLGTDEEGLRLLQMVLKLNSPMVIDADALNMLGKQRSLLNQLTEGCVLTPHMKEFDFLFGEHVSWWERLQTAREKAKQINCIIVLKNQYTFIVGPEGNVTVNPTGNPAMAQGGMGDVLTGFIVSFLAQGYTAYQAAVIACYLHGMAGDELAKERISVTASAVADQLPGTLKRLIR
jgi:hydroxyethylthiazole kinase-like uncharacterized protein yjeF